MADIRSFALLSLIMDCSICIPEYEMMHSSHVPKIHSYSGHHARVCMVPRTRRHSRLIIQPNGYPSPLLFATGSLALCKIFCFPVGIAINTRVQRIILCKFRIKCFSLHYIISTTAFIIVLVTDCFTFHFEEFSLDANV
ncbi:hypothetical protein CEXT_703721 [Caerostris extrusa]|uniref:Uncharacterized protein n=1 Tax=Caerostris extrusa TaxID=172846 RepID=A0AAV4N7S5_CAEEX|nr:hypothetical protein CEXT_703721 [Caerostris extrusa]